MVVVRKYKRCYYVLFACAFTYIMFVTVQYSTIQYSKRKFVSHYDAKSGQCLVPNMDPFHHTVKQFYQKLEKYHCNGKPSFIEVIDGNILKINKKILQNHYNQQLGKCFYQAIERKSDDFKHPDDRVAFENRKNTFFSDKIEVQDEFVKIICKNNDSEIFYEELKALIITKPKVEERLKKIQNKFPGKKMSVLVFGIDSVSRLNFLRHFTKTYQFLKEKEAVELTSYNKVGDGTIDNMIPVLTGNFLSHYWEEGQPSSFDHIDVLWKYFSAKGYRTMFMEDAPDWGMFNYEKTGFYRQPTDYYYRPFAAALDVSKRRKESRHHCIGNELEFKFVLDWGKMFAEKFKNEQYFQWTFLTRLAHNQLNYVGYADDPTFQFFNDLYESESLNNTLVVFMSDHGIRYGEIRKTEIGKMEQNTPFCFLLLPDWFKKRNPQIVQNLKINERRLTTPFDVYNMLREVLDYRTDESLDSKTQNLDCSHGVSLFREIPEFRTCEDASIPKNYCSCDFYVDSDNMHTATEASKFAVEHINTKLKTAFDKCAKLSFSKVLSARYQKNFGSGSEYHQIIFEVMPSLAQFEITVSHNVEDGGFQIIGDISRVNRYHKQSDCIHSRFLKSFCFCKSLLS